MVARSVKLVATTTSRCSRRKWAWAVIEQHASRQEEEEEVSAQPLTTPATSRMILDVVLATAAVAKRLPLTALTWWCRSQSIGQRLPSCDEPLSLKVGRHHGPRAPGCRGTPSSWRSSWPPPPICRCLASMGLVSRASASWVAPKVWQADFPLEADFGGARLGTATSSWYHGPLARRGEGGLGQRRILCLMRRAGPWRQHGVRCAKRSAILEPWPPHHCQELRVCPLCPPCPQPVSATNHHAASSMPSQPLRRL